MNITGQTVIGGITKEISFDITVDEFKELSVEIKEFFADGEEAPETDNPSTDAAEPADTAPVADNTDTDSKFAELPVAVDPVPTPAPAATPAPVPVLAAVPPAV